MSKYNPVSVYPSDIDPPTFFNDLDIENKEVLSTSLNYVENKDFDGAIDYLIEQVEDATDHHIADLYNMMIDRVKKLQEYLNSLNEGDRIVWYTITNNNTYDESNNTTNAPMLLNSGKSLRSSSGQTATIRADGKQFTLSNKFSFPEGLVVDGKNYPKIYYELNTDKWGFVTITYNRSADLSTDYDILYNNYLEYDKKVANNAYRQQVFIEYWVQPESSYSFEKKIPQRELIPLHSLQTLDQYGNSLASLIQSNRIAVVLPRIGYDEYAGYLDRPGLYMWDNALNYVNCIYPFSVEELQAVLLIYANVPIFYNVSVNSEDVISYLKDGSLNSDVVLNTNSAMQSLSDCIQPDLWKVACLDYEFFIKHALLPEHSYNRNYNNSMTFFDQYYYNGQKNNSGRLVSRRYLRNGYDVDYYIYIADIVAEKPLVGIIDRNESTSLLKFYTVNEDDTDLIQLDSVENEWCYNENRAYDSYYWTGDSVEITTELRNSMLNYSTSFSTNILTIYIPKNDSLDSIKLDLIAYLNDTANNNVWETNSLNQRIVNTNEIVLHDDFTIPFTGSKTNYPLDEDGYHGWGYPVAYPDITIRTSFGSQIIPTKIIYPIEHTYEDYYESLQQSYNDYCIASGRDDLPTFDEWFPDQWTEFEYYNGASGYIVKDLEDCKTVGVIIKDKGFIWWHIVNSETYGLGIRYMNDGFRTPDNSYINTKGRWIIMNSKNYLPLDYINVLSVNFPIFELSLDETTLNSIPDDGMSMITRDLVTQIIQSNPQIETYVKTGEYNDEDILNPPSLFQNSGTTQYEKVYVSVYDER